MTAQDFEDYTGNLRIVSINFDGLREMWNGSLDQYDPDKDELRAKPYVGKVGAYVSGSYIFNQYTQSACIVVKFANDYEVMTDAGDVVKTDEDITREEFLPVYHNTDDYRKLTQAEKDLAEKLMISMVTGVDPNSVNANVIATEAIAIAIQATKSFALLWRDTK